MAAPLPPGSRQEGRADGGSPLVVLLTAIALEHRDGSTMYTRDLALELGRGGHRPIVYSPRLGPVADELVDAGIDVLGHLTEPAIRPDVIHGNQTVETVEALLRFRDVPAVFVCHGPRAWMAEPPRLSAVAHWVAVGTATANRLLDAGLPSERCHLVPNGVDTERFRLSLRPLPELPQRALVFSNNAAPGGYLDVVERVCRSRGIELDVAGRGVGRPVAAPAEVLGDYDLVFARGRCAREAIACGCAVVVVDIEGEGGLVTTDHLDRFQAAAFGSAILTAPHDEMTLGRAVDGYDPVEARAVSARLRDEGSVARMAQRLVELYREAIASPPAPDPEHDRRWVLDQLPVLSRLGWERDEVLLARHLLHQHAVSLEARVLEAEPALSTAQEQLVASEHALLGAEQARARAEAELAELRATRTVRLRDWLLDRRRLFRR